MLLDILRSVFSRSKLAMAASDSVDKIFAEAVELSRNGLIREAITKYKILLDIDESNVRAMNNIGSCFVDLGEGLEAAEWFRRAIYVDDNFSPGLVNYARHLGLNYMSVEAERFLLMARRLTPGVPHIDANLSSTRMVRGDCQGACSYMLSAWLKEFDVPTFASSYLFLSGYDALVSTERNYQERAFWSATLSGGLVVTSVAEFDSFVESGWGGGKVRIGYISPDFKNHSVRYFLRPLLEGHDRSRVELYGYNDSSVVDEQGVLIRQQFDVIRDVANMPSAELVDLLRSDQLDVLVELAGHTSTSRLTVFQNKLARIQMTGLGEPLTTGLDSIDYKIVDEVSAPEGSEALYSEGLLRLPGSFWCFNPLEATPDVASTPASKEGYVTFGCFGNIAKFSDDMLACWAGIMTAVPLSRLILKSLSFQDEEAKLTVVARLLRCGFDIARVRLDLPDAPGELFSAYAEVDIVLDTYPFNGGTTTCFSLWMGVPFVTLAGEGLISRMGASMLSVLELNGLIAETFTEYAAKVVDLACDVERLIELRSGIRAKMLATSLGNGAIYARNFEDACVDLLARPRIAPVVERTALPEWVLVERADLLLRYHQLGAAGRVIGYCLAHYPSSVGAIIQRSELLEFEQGVSAAREYLLEACSRLSGDSEVALRVNIMRSDLMLENYAAVECFAQRFDLEWSDHVARNYVQLYQVAARAGQAKNTRATVASGSLPFVSVLVSCVDDQRFSEVQANLAVVMTAGAYELIRVAGASRVEGYVGACIAEGAEIVLLLREDVRIEAENFHARLAAALGVADLVGMLGADRLDSEVFAQAGERHVFGAQMRPAIRRKQGYDCVVYGAGRQEIQQGMQVLDQGLLGVKAAVFREVRFDSALYAGGGLCELDWTHKVFERGFKLAVAPCLGGVCYGVEVRSGREWAESAEVFAGRYGLRGDGDDVSILVGGVSVPVASPKAGLEFLDAWYLAPNL